MALGTAEETGVPTPSPILTGSSLTPHGPERGGVPEKTSRTTRAARGPAEEPGAPTPSPILTGSSLTPHGPEREDVPENTILTNLDAVVNWCRKNSLWPMPFATARCGIELMAVGASRFDIARFGAEVMRFSPRQCDLMIVAGRVVMKMMPVLQRIWLQMPEPKWCISMGACASTGGIFDTYSVVQGVDRFMPVDIYIPGCPPPPRPALRPHTDPHEEGPR